MQHRLAQIERPILSDNIVERLITYIAENKLSPGDALPSEKDLTQALCVSRLPLREAISRLRALGIISVRQGKGMSVRRVDVGNLFRQLSPIIRSQGHPNLVHMVEARLAIEPSIAALAAQRRDDNVVSRLCDRIEGMAENLGDKATFIRCDIEFHQILAESSRNPVLLVIVDTIQDIISAVQSVYPDDAGVRARSLMHHRRILKSVAEGSAGDAALAMQAHLEEIATELRGADIE